MKKTFMAVTLWAALCPVFAQMSMTFTGISDVTTKQLSTGCTLVEFPVGTDLTSVMAKAAFMVDGTAIDASQIVPNPSTLSLADGEEIMLLYKGKGYGFKFSEGKYFTAVFLSDPHIEHAGHDATSVANMQSYVSKIVNMGKTGGAAFAFDALPGYMPSCDIAFSTGDMDADSKKNDDEFNTAHAGFASAGIPFVTMCGNHDLVPDYWTGEDGDKGLTYGLNDGGSYANDVALSTVESYRKALGSYGISDVETITDGTDHTQFNPFSFTFNGVRFYVGQTYWFQKPYKKPTLLSSATYYAPDGVISSLESFVGKHADEPSVWMQHYPFVAGSDCDRWWLDQNDVGRYIKTSDASAYGTNDDVAVYTDESAKAVAAKKKDKLAEIINKTKNPVHFSGHTHSFSVNTYGGIKDYTTAASGYTDGAAYIVLMKGGKGVVEVKQVQFNPEVMASVNSQEQVIYTADDNAVAVRLRSALQSLGVEESSLPSLETVKDADGVGQAIESMSDTFSSAMAEHGTETVDVTAMLGDNTDFETTQGSASSSLSNVFTQPGWNVNVASFSNTSNAQYIKLQQSTDRKASGTHSLYLRAKWQDRIGTVQVMKQTALPAGVYELGYSSALVGTLVSNLNYVEVGGVRKSLPMDATSSLAAKTVTLVLTKPQVVTLSYGFDGGYGSAESAVYVDNLHLIYKGEVKAGSDVTSLISNATFTEGTVSKTVQGSGGKVEVPSGWDFQYSYSGWNDTYVNNGLFNAWAGTINRAELSQSLTLPNGAYRLTAEIKTDMEADASTIAIYGAGANGLIGRSQEVGKGNGDFSKYSCSFDVTDGNVTIGIRSDKAYYQVKNFTLTYLGASAEEETAASYLRQDYYWNGRNSQEFDASQAKYAAAKGVVVYPKVKNQLVKAASVVQFAATDNKIVDGICQRLVLTDKEPFSSSSAFTAVEAIFERTFTKGTVSTVCLPFAPTVSNGQFYRLDREDTDNNALVFVEENSPEANTPYIYIASEDGKLWGANVGVEATPTAMRSGATSSGIYMEGVYATKSVSNIYGFDTSGQLLKASTATMTPFRAFIQSPGDVQTAKVWTSVFEHEATGIANTRANGNDGCDVYGIDGVLVRSGASEKAALDGLKRGLYIIKNGSETRKILKR